MPTATPNPLYYKTLYVLAYYVYWSHDGGLYVVPSPRLTDETNTFPSHAFDYDYYDCYPPNDLL